ncbi:MAG: UxaA family hydrolase [Peptococcales bacterium]|jgi:altronate dehydratase small subunit
MPKKTNFVVDERDNVTTILQEGLLKGSKIEVKYGENSEFIELVDQIKYGHKVAIKPIKNGEKITKYGLTIGIANRNIDIGEHVHIQNVESIRGRGDLAKGR